MISGQMDLIHIIRNASLMVQFVLLLLLFFSVTSWAIIFIKYRYIKRACKESAFFTDFFGKAGIFPLLLRRLNSFRAVPWPDFFESDTWN